MVVKIVTAVRGKIQCSIWFTKPGITGDKVRQQEARYSSLSIFLPSWQIKSVVTYPGQPHTLGWCWSCKVRTARITVVVVPSLHNISDGGICSFINGEMSQVPEYIVTIFARKYFIVSVDRKFRLGGQLFLTFSIWRFKYFSPCLLFNIIARHNALSNKQEHFLVFYKQ